MARPRRAQPTPSWSSSSRMSKKTFAGTNTSTKPKNTNVQVVLYDRPRYIAGISTVASRPITLVPRTYKTSTDYKNAYIVDKVVTPFDGWGPQAATAEDYDTEEEDARYAADPARRRVQRVLNYVVGWRDEPAPYTYELVPCTRILEYVSPYVLEAYEYELSQRQQQRRRHRQRRQQPHCKAKAGEANTDAVAEADKVARKKKQTQTQKKDKSDTGKDEDRVKQALAQQRDGNGKFFRKGDIASIASIASTPGRNTLAAVPPASASPVPLGLTPSKRAGPGLSQPVISLSLIPSLSIPSLSPSKQRAVPKQGLGEQTTSLKRPFDSFAEHFQEQTETDEEEEEGAEDSDDGDDSDDSENSEDSEEDELHVSLPRVTQVPLPAFASASASASISTLSPRSTPSFVPPPSRGPASSTQHKVTRVEPPRVMGMRSEAPAKKVKLEAKSTSDDTREKKDNEKKKEKTVTPVPPPVFGASQHRQSESKNEPPKEEKDEEQDEDEDEDEEDMYEVDRLEGDCYTYIDDDARGVLPDGTPQKKLVQYFSVRWKGNWPPDQNPTWEPAENLPPGMVQQYLRALARQEQALKQAQLGGASRYDGELLLDASSDDDGRVSQDVLAPVVSSDII